MDKFHIINFFYGVIITLLLLVLISATTTEKHKVSFSNGSFFDHETQIIYVYEYAKGKCVRKWKVNSLGEGLEKLE